MSTLPIAFDDGTSAQVPMDKVPAALKDGGKVVQAMHFDDGSMGYVPLENVHAAVQDGGTVIGSPPQRPTVSMPVPGALSRGATAFGAAAGDLLQAGTQFYSGAGAGESYNSPAGQDYYKRTGDWRGAIKQATQERIANEPSPLDELGGAAKGAVNLVTSPIERAASGDVAGAIGEGAANLPAIFQMGKGAKDLADTRVGQTAMQGAKFAGKVADVGSFGRLSALYRAAQDTMAKVRDIWADHPEIAPQEEPQPTYNYRNAGAGQRDVIRPRGLLQQENGIQNADFEPVYTQNRGLLPSGSYQQPPSSIPDLPFLRPFQYRMTNLPPEEVGAPPAPNPRVLAGNQGIITSPLGFLPEYHPVSDAAFMNPERMAYSQRPQFVPGERDALEDASIRDAMEADLQSHGNAALADESRQFRAGYDVSTPKWLLNAQQKANQVMQDAETRATRPVRYTKTPSLSKFPTDVVQRMKGGNGTPSVPTAGEDLTPMLEKSLQAIRKKRGGQ